MGTITKIWTYNSVVFRGDIYFLLAERIGSEGAFRHVPCAALVTPHDDAAHQGFEDLRSAGKLGVQRETGLNPQHIGGAPFLFIDRTSDSDWGGAPVAHILFFHGKVTQLLELKHGTVDTPNGPRGVRELAWVKLDDIEVSSKPNKNVNAAASQFASYDGLARRSMIARVIGRYMIPLLSQTMHGAAPVRRDGPLTRLQGNTITNAPERHPSGPN